MLYDLNSLPELDISAPHWYQGWNDNVTINNKLFSIAGDASLEVLENIEVIFFNKNIAENHNLNLYQLVNDGKWTLEKMNEINQQVAANLDNDNTFDDIWGALYDTHSLGCQLYAAGMQLSKIADDGTISVTPNTERLVAVVDAVTNLLHSGTVRYDQNTARSGKNQGLGFFTNANALFYATALYLGNNIRQANAGIDYGVIIPPKFDEKADYITSCYGASLFAIPHSVKSPHVSATILDALNYFSNETVVESFYEVVLKGQIADAQEDADMIDMARSTLYVEFAFINSLQTYTSAKNAAASKAPIASMLAASQKLTDKTLSNLLKAYE